MVELLLKGSASMEKSREVERSIIKRFRKEIWSKFVKAVKDYELIAPNDKIAVCISGGKDSFLLAKCMQELKRHGQFGFDLEFILMNPGYKEEHLQQILENAELLDIPLHTFSTDVFDVANQLDVKPCYLCARMRRGHLYDFAQKLGCNKIALGHHFDDVIETTLLNVLYAGEFKTMMPKLPSDHFQGMELIRPLYLVKEQDIMSWRDYNELTFLNCACKFVEDSQNESNSKRKEMKELIATFRKTNPFIESNIFRCAENVNLDSVRGYFSDDVKKDFHAIYEDRLKHKK